jgi:predicted nucleic acid-binding protein
MMQVTGANPKLAVFSIILYICIKPNSVEVSSCLSRKTKNNTSHQEKNTAISFARSTCILINATPLYLKNDCDVSQPLSITFFDEIVVAHLSHQ